MAETRRGQAGRARRKTLDELNDEVIQAFAEQRDFTLFCFDKLRTEMVERFDGVDQRFDGVDQRFDGVDQRFDGIDQRLDGIDQRLDGIDRRFDGVDKRFDGVDQRLDGIGKRFDGIDNRLSTHELLLHEVLNEVRAIARRT